MRSLRLRLILLAVGTSALALLIAGVVIAGLLRQFVESRVEASLDATMVALMANVQVDPTVSRIEVDAAVADPHFEQPFSGWYWQIADDQSVLLRSGSLWNGQLGTGAAAPDGIVHREEITGPKSERLLLFWRDFTVPGRMAPLRVSASTPLAEVEADVRAIVQPLVISLVLLGIALALAIAVQVNIGLRPLFRLRRELDEIEAGERTSLSPVPYSEIAPIAAQMNVLLAHSVETIERARTHVGNLAHGLKTPLSVLTSFFEKPQRSDEDSKRAQAATGSMDRLISYHLRRARSAATVGMSNSRTAVAPAVDDLLPVFKGIYADRELSFDVQIEAGLVFAGDVEDFDELLGNLIDNACKWAGNTVRVVGQRDDGQDRLSIEVADDGPGLADEQLELALQRGRRFDEAQPGTGLGLAIVVDLARFYGGDLLLGRASIGGLSATLRLPTGKTSKAKQ